MFKEEKLIDALPPKNPVYTDNGFEGLDKLREDIEIRKPKKRERRKN